MALKFGKGEDVVTLITKKNYTKAIEVLKAQLASETKDPRRLKMQLADVLVLSGKASQAITILTPLADEFAREGFVPQAISVFKKIQKIDPGRRDVEAKLASLIQAKQRVATVSAAPPSRGMEMGMEIGIEEIGFEPLPGPTSRSSARLPAVEPEPPAAEPPRRRPPDIDLEPEAVDLSFTPAPKEPVAPAPDEPEFMLEPAEPLMLDAPAPEPTPAPAPPPRATPPVAASPAPVEDRDLFLEDVEGEPEFLEEAEVEAEPVGELEIIEEPDGTQPAVGAPDPMSDGAFADELLSLVDQAFQAVPDAGLSALPEEEESGGAQIVVSPLFKNFSVEELVAVIQGLNLLTFEDKQIIIREGDPGNSLYMLTAGTVKAYKKNAAGKHVKVGELQEGAFFGEGSILTGKPRNATIVATERAELLELDRPTLDDITRKHPHVWQVLQEFAEQRTSQR